MADGQPDADGFWERVATNLAAMRRLSDQKAVRIPLAAVSSIRLRTSAATSSTSVGARTALPQRSRKAAIRGANVRDFELSLERTSSRTLAWRPRIAPGTDQVGTVHATSAETGVTSSTVEPTLGSQGSE